MTDTASSDDDLDAQSLKEQIDRSRTPEFMARLHRNTEKHKVLLDRLAEDD